MGAELQHMCKFVQPKYTNILFWKRGKHTLRKKHEEENAWKWIVYSGLGNKWAYDSDVWCHSAHQSIKRLKKRKLFPEKADISRVWTVFVLGMLAIALIMDHVKTRRKRILTISSGFPHNFEHFWLVWNNGRTFVGTMAELLKRDTSNKETIFPLIAIKRPSRTAYSRITLYLSIYLSVHPSIHPSIPYR